MACNICNDAVIVDRKGPERTAAQARASVKSCSYCKIIVEVLDEHNIDDEQELRFWRDDSDVFRRKTDGITVSATGVEFVIRRLDGIGSEELSMVLGSGCPNTGSLVALAWAKEKIQECREKHSDCNQYTMRLPDRVLDLGSGSDKDGGWLMSDVRLYESKNEEEPYTTLSHRWGLEVPLRLLQKNIEEFRKLIEWKALPLTFQQAIRVARQLGVRYIWIDSLCIIQDSAEDWENQSSKMASIYENSFITLAATVAKDGRAGCFVDPPLFQQGYVTDGEFKVSAYNNLAVQELIANTTDDKHLAYIRCKIQHFVPDRIGSGTLPLLTRGWVYQERLLSPRILHFGDVDVMYECSLASGSCYCKQWRHPGSRNVAGHPVKSQHASALRHHPDYTPTMASFAGRWGRLIEEYSELDLTYSADKLPAIAGVAKQASRILKDSRYVNGMWHASLTTCLAWKRRENPPTRSPEQYRPGPSWTWITMPGAVAFPQGWRLESEVDAAFVKSSFEYKEENFMRLIEGSITLRGNFVPARLRVIHRKSKFVPNEERDYRVVRLNKKPLPLVQLDREPTEEDFKTHWYPIKPRWVTPEHSGIDPQAVTLPPDEDVDEEEPSCLWSAQLKWMKQYSKPIWLLGMGTWAEDGGSSDNFLLLECVDESEPELSRKYRRIGLGYCEAFSSSEPSIIRDVAGPWEIDLI